ncbi:M48 family metallopeptidase [Ideonella livida]|uniref:M48 family metallopeptidase n=1 Tax=Ideonella livida TaxID=2707176 RepID=A0A7C9PIN8_9BURK|nr:M48 family metallopeptidase [Ideonella livida]NDY92973.1 M48 family metallopeptidase [Ideonella livida]
MTSCPAFHTDAELALPPLVQARRAATCACHQPVDRHRRRLGAGASLAVAGAWGLAPLSALAAEEGVRGEVGSTSRFAKLVSAEEVEQAAQQQFTQMKQEAAGKRALAPDDHPQVLRLRAIAQRLIPYTQPWNNRASAWKWEVQLFGSKELNAFCMPGGKIAFYFGILQRLQLSDDEVAMIMGHEMAHALREHARERMGKSAATRAGAGLLSSLLGLGNLGDAALSMGAQLLSLKFSREDESEADLVGMELAARAGYDPASGVTLWQKMMKASEGAPPEFLSTHPASKTRIQEIQSHLPKVNGLYAKAARPTQRYQPPV